VTFIANTCNNASVPGQRGGVERYVFDPPPLAMNEALIFRRSRSVGLSVVVGISVSMINHPTKYVAFPIRVVKNEIMQSHLILSFLSTPLDYPFDHTYDYTPATSSINTTKRINKYATERSRRRRSSPRPPTSRSTSPTPILIHFVHFRLRNPFLIFSHTAQPSLSRCSNSIS
jgi:hypothetical protein